jgi:hypothetical protein
LEHSSQWPISEIEGRVAEAATNLIEGEEKEEEEEGDDNDNDDDDELVGENKFFVSCNIFKRETMASIHAPLSSFKI